MEYSSVAILVGTLLAAASVIFGAKYKQGKDKAKQLNGFLTTIMKTAEDDRVTEKEFQSMMILDSEVLTLTPFGSGKVGETTSKLPALRQINIKMCV